ncbi:hypothetical protein GGS20DRAFT_99458 [Poronia punctata]|nr:hypothetical protein GGS20DRAFT_99458 [Poronia punctata]
MQLRHYDHHTSLTALLTIWLTICGISPGNAQDLGAILTSPSNKWASTTTVSFPGSERFANATLRWDVYAPPTYLAAISPGNEADVVKSVQLATTYNIPFLATGGRHGYTTTLSKLKNGLAIDLSKLNSVHVNQTAETVTIGGGARVSEVFDPVYNAGFELQTVTSQCPGMLGSTLGAGVGRDEGRYGLVLDALQSVRLVTADARILEVSETSNADLFWAIRGAGANFGVVTSATYKLHRIPASDGYDGLVTSVDVIIPANMTAAYFDTVVESYNGSLPYNLAAETLVMYNTTSGATELLANWAYFGPKAEALKAIAPILDLNPPIVSTNVVPWNQLVNTVMLGTDSATCMEGRSASIYGVNMRAMSPSTYQTAVEKMTRFYSDNPGGRQSILTLEMFPNAAARAVPDSATAYPWRDTIASLLIIMVDAGEAGDKVGAELRGDFVATSGYPDLAVYVNYVHGDESLAQVYGKAQLPKLAALKKKWDPNNVFGFSNALPTQYP